MFNKIMFAPRFLYYVWVCKFKKLLIAAKEGIPQTGYFQWNYDFDNILKMFKFTLNL